MEQAQIENPEGVTERSSASQSQKCKGTFGEGTAS